MANSGEYVRCLRAAWLQTEAHDDIDDYVLIEPIGAAYAARARNGLAAIVIPLAEVDRFAVGRRAAGCELVPIKNATFRFRERAWESAGAALVCHDDDAIEAFRVLAADVITRIGDHPAWKMVVDAVQEWQSLLASKGRPSAEGELGLWGELWFIAAALRAEPLLAAWRGPERDSTDFFFEGMSAEVKTSRYRRRHHVSLSQVPEPVGTYPAWILSLWVKEDPGRGRTVTEMVEDLEARCEDAGELLRRLLRAGFSTRTRTAYATKYLLLGEPEWYAAADVPTVRSADAGVSEVRFRVDLDEQSAADPGTAERLWKHFLGRAYAALST